MKRFRPSQKLLIFIYGTAIVWFCHHFIFRPIILDWGAPAAIRDHAFSGDTLTAGSGHTRAVLIEATPEEIWPWLIQIGQDRGGFYSYQWLENIFRADMENVYAIKPEYQFPRLQGDTVWMASKDNYNGSGYQRVAEITPLKSFVMVGAQDYLRINENQKASGSWAFYLYPESANRTWLIARSSEGEIGFVNKLLKYCFYEVPHFIMERKMLRTIQELSENGELISVPDESMSYQ